MTHDAHATFLTIKKNNLAYADFQKLYLTFETEVEF